MATINVTEGQCYTVMPADSLCFPSIDSCLSITCVLPQITRVAGHAVLMPAPEHGQLTLQQICDYIYLRKGGDSLYIIGDIGTWDDSWDLLPQCQHLTIHGQPVTSVQGIATALGFTGSKAVLLDTTTSWGRGSYNVWFGFENNHRSLWAVKSADGSRKVVPGHPAW